MDTSPAKGLAYPRRRTQFSLYADESDNGTYPFPLAAAIEGAYPGCPPSSCTGDRHVLAIDNATCTLWEAANCIAPSSLAGEAVAAMSSRLQALPCQLEYAHTASLLCMHAVLLSKLPSVSFSILPHQSAALPKFTCSALGLQRRRQVQPEQPARHHTPPGLDQRRGRRHGHHTRPGQAGRAAPRRHPPRAALHRANRAARVPVPRLAPGAAEGGGAP